MILKIISARSKAEEGFPKKDKEAEKLEIVRSQIYAWCVHLFTATGAILGLFAIYAIHEGFYLRAFWLMSAAIIVDAIDGTFARLVRVKVVLPGLNGELLDNIIDYVNYVIVPAFFLLVSDLLPYGWHAVGACAILIGSAYQFCQEGAKTNDHFFKGFPSYWNIVVFYLFLWQTSPSTNIVTILFLTAMVFVPIKYVYPTRLEYLTRRAALRTAMLYSTIAWGVATLALLWSYPSTNLICVITSIGYLIAYFTISLYRTLFPIKIPQNTMGAVSLRISERE